MHTLILNTDDEITAVKAQIMAPPPNGFDLGGMKEALDLAAALDAAEAGRPLELQDKHYAQLQRRMREARWSRATPELVDLVERCLNAPRGDAG